MKLNKRLQQHLPVHRFLSARRTARRYRRAGSAELHAVPTADDPAEYAERRGYDQAAVGIRSDFELVLHRQDCR